MAGILLVQRSKDPFGELRSLSEGTILAAGVEIARGATASKDNMALDNKNTTGRKWTEAATAVLASLACRGFHARLLNNRCALSGGCATVFDNPTAPVHILQDGSSQQPKLKISPEVGRDGVAAFVNTNRLWCKTGGGGAGHNG